MRSYWLRMIFGALAVFAIGMVGVSMIRRGRAKVTEVMAGTGPLTIPLPFVPSSWTATSSAWSSNWW